ncbi:MAG: glycosyltransferase [Methanobacterium paludis]|nr:glycosyltransferase [Methanobacterium paludis]
MIKVIFTTHQTGFNICGGAEIQMIKTMESLNKLYNDQIKVNLFDPWHDNMDDYDVIHIFNPMAFPCEALRIAQYSKEKGLKVIISSIYYSYLPKEEKSILKNIFDHFINILSRFKLYISTFKSFEYLDRYKDVEKAFLEADKILPNTVVELGGLLNKFSKVPKDKYELVPNAADSKFKNGNAKVFKDKYGMEDFILFVGRIETRKNVLGLINAFVESGLKTKLIIIGKIHEKDYYEHCKEKANENVIFIPPIKNDSELLASAYKAAKVLALPSFYETPGLAALEAGLSGSNIVITEFGGTKDYFEDYVWYVDPENEESIKNALINAYKTSKTDKLSKHIENNYTWEKVAEKMLNIYKS